MVRSFKHMPYQDRLKALKTISIKDRIKRGDLIGIYKIMSGKLNVKREVLQTEDDNNNNNPIKLYKEQSFHSIPFHCLTYHTRKD